MLRLLTVESLTASPLELYSRLFFGFFIVDITVSLNYDSDDNRRQLLAVDLSARVSMTNAASCEM